jgi:rhomboid family protein
VYQEASNRRITPWVGRLLAINAVVLLLQETLLTSPAVTGLLRFDPLNALQRPWTFFTYMFVHGGLLHLATNSLALFVFGPPVERRFGSRAFLIYYLYCGLGSAILALALSAVMPIAPFIGASGAILGVALAFAHFAPDAELLIFPLPFPLKARQLVWLFVGLDLAGMILGGGQIAHVAHLGGLAAGWLFFAVQGMGRPVEAARLPSFRQRATVAVNAEDARKRPAAAEPRRTAPVAPEPTVDLGTAEALEIDRVLDKISATGIASLTAEERRFLDNVSQRKRHDDPH